MIWMTDLHRILRCLSVSAGVNTLWIGARWGPAYRPSQPASLTTSSPKLLIFTTNLPSVIVCAGICVAHWFAVRINLWGKQHHSPYACKLQRSEEADTTSQTACPLESSTVTDSLFCERHFAFSAIVSIFPPRECFCHDLMTTISPKIRDESCSQKKSMSFLLQEAINYRTSSFIHCDFMISPMTFPKRVTIFHASNALPGWSTRARLLFCSERLWQRDEAERGSQTIWVGTEKTKDRQRLWFSRWFERLNAAFAPKSKSRFENHLEASNSFLSFSRLLKRSGFKFISVVQCFFGPEKKTQGIFRT